MASLPSDFPVTAETIDEVQGDGSLYFVTAFRLDSVNATGGRLLPVVETTWSIRGKPGMFTSQVPFDWEWSFAAAIDLAVTYRQIMDIYAL